MIETPALIPELDVTDLTESVFIYVNVFGFELLFDRPDEGFAYLALGSAHIMLQAADGPGRRFVSAPLSRPFGRGLNLQILVDDAVALYGKICAAGMSVVIPIEERWYQQGDISRGNMQFVVADSDGYLLRFFNTLGVQTVG